MNIDSLTPDSLHRYIPNVLAVTDGEPTLFEKLRPFIEESKLRLESRYVGEEDFLSPGDNEIAVRLVVLDALANAIPSIDLVVTPTGFGVVNTNNLAPASKDRVERLINSLRKSFTSGLALLLRACRQYQAWRESTAGAMFCATIVSPFDDIGVDGCDYAAVCRILSEARSAEFRLADKYLGHALMNELRRICNEEDGGEVQIVSLARHAVVSMVSAAESGEPLGEQQVWLLARNILQSLIFFSDLKAIRDHDPGMAAPEPFVNDRKGGFVF